MKSMAPVLGSAKREEFGAHLSGRPSPCRFGPEQFGHGKFDKYHLR